MSYKLSGPTCRERSCSRPVYDDTSGLCRRHHDLAVAFGYDAARESPPLSSLPVPDHQSNDFLVALNAWRAA